MSEAQKKKRLDPEAMQARLTDFIAGETGLAPTSVKVGLPRRLAGGSSRLLFAVDVELEDAATGPRSLELVLRQDPPGRIQEGGMALEFDLLREAGAIGVPVPKVHWCCTDEGVLGSPFFAMDRLDGEAIPRRLLRDDRYAKAREGLGQELATALAGIHRLDLETTGLGERLPRPTKGRSAAETAIELVARGYRASAVEPHPVVELAERWLRQHLPAPSPLAFVHGDFRTGNFMFDEQGLVAVLDWEIPHVGDPVEDLGWLCVRAWRFGADDRPAGGLTSREALLEAYEAAGGRSVSLEALRFWEVAGNFKLALVFIAQSRAYLDGAHKTVELASLGRRTAEAEDELLRLID